MKRFAKICPVLFCLFFLTGILWAVDIPNGYGNIKLGMSLETVKEALKENTDFGYKGERDVSLLAGDNRVLIETDTSRSMGIKFLDRCWFQFYEDKLYTIIINVNKEKMDYYSIFTTLCDKYGSPESLNPSKAIWQNDEVTMSLEKPLTLKYVDNKVFDELQDKATVRPSSTEMTREMFLEGL